MSEGAPLNDETMQALQVYGDATEAALPDARAEQLWRHVKGRDVRRPRLTTLAVFAAACAAGALLVFAATRAIAPAPAPAVAAFEPLAGARVQVDGELAQLELGRLRARASGSSRKIVTPQVSIVLVDARALVEVTAERTVIVVEDGEVSYSGAVGTRRARAGQRVAVPEGLPIASAPSASCEGPCRAQLEDASRGDGLTAQTALYELGLRASEAGQLDAARARFREYLKRFPDGVLASEASIALMVAERSLGDLPAARAEAAAFLSRFSTDPRAAQVGAWAKELP